MRLVIVDDHVLFRRCVVEYLDNQPDITVVGQFSMPGSARQALSDLKPDIVLVDVDLGGQSGFALAEEILREHDGCIVVMLTASDSEANMQAAIDIGASGYLVKNIEPQHLRTVLQRIMEGGLEFPRDFLVHHLRGAPETGEDDEELEHSMLTSREIEVLQLMTDGLMDKEIAESLAISEHTVKKHEQSLRKKLGVENRLLASQEGVRRGLTKYRRK